MIYAGIGSRSIPLDVEILMYEIGQHLGKLGWTLRSGHAIGSDLAFENGCKEVGGKKEIFTAEDATPEAIEYSLKFHPNPKAILKKPYVSKLMGRNAQIILGRNLDIPSKYVICYCRYDDEGNWIGGTSQGLRIAKHHGIKIFNLFHDEVKRNFIKKIAGGK